MRYHRRLELYNISTEARINSALKKNREASVYTRREVSHPSVNTPSMPMNPFKTPSPYVRRHDHINRVKSESSSKLPLVSLRGQNHEGLPGGQWEVSVEPRYSLGCLAWEVNCVDLAPLTDFDSAVVIKMFVGFQAVRALSHESDLSCRKDYEVISVHQASVLRLKNGGVVELK